MNSKLLQLAERHGALKAKIDAQRGELAKHAQPIEVAFGHGDAVLRGVDWLKHHPAAVFVAVAAAVVARPRRMWRWAQRGFFLWRGWQTLRKSILGRE